MTKRLISWDDEKPGTGLPDAVQQKLDAANNATYALKGETGINPDDLGYDIVLAIGQSNMDGRGTAFSAYTDPADARIWQYPFAGANARTIGIASEPLVGQGGTPSGIGPALQFCRWYAQTSPANRRVLVVPAAKGGTRIGLAAEWDPAGSSNLLTAAIAHAQSALTAAGPGSRIVAALWVQGESDGDSTYSGANYQAKLDALIGRVRSELGEPDLPFIIGQMVPERLVIGTRAEINAVHWDTPNRLDQIGFAPAFFGNDPSDDHYNAAGYRRLARALFDAYRRVVTETAQPTRPTVPPKVTGLATSAVTDTSLTLTWNAATGADRYHVERRADGGAWTRIAVQPGLTLNVTGHSAGVVYDFRVRGLSLGGPGEPSDIVTAGTPAPVVPVVPVADEVTGTLWRAYSTRKVRAGYSGPAVQVRRSTDGAVQDIGFTAAGHLDTTALTAFAGSGSATVATLYDQSGNGLHLTQPTVAAQPRIVNAGSMELVSGKPAPRFLGAAYFTDMAPGMRAATENTVCAVVQGTYSATEPRIVAEGSTTSDNPQFALMATRSAGSVLTFVRGDVITEVAQGVGPDTPKLLDGTPSQASVVASGTTLTRRCRGVADPVTTTFTRTGITVDNFTLGAVRRTAVSSHLTGWLPEVLIWSTALSGADLSVVEASQKAHYGVAG